jgi:hypothetical protein
MEDVGNDLWRLRRRQRLAVEHRLDPPLRVTAGGNGFGPPPVEQPLIELPAVFFGRAGLENGHLVEAPATLRGQLPTQLCLGFGDQLPSPRFHRGRPFREQGAKFGRDTDDLRLAVAVHRRPRHTEPVREFHAQCRLVHHAGRLQLAVQRPRVERPPYAVGAAHPSGNQDMGVQLRVTGPRRAMDERRGQESLGVDLAHSRLALTAEGGVVLQIVQRRGHGGVVRVAHLHADLAADRGPQRRHGLRCRERQVPPGHPIRAVPHPIRLAEALVRPRVHAVEQAHQLLRCDLPAQADTMDEAARADIADGTTPPARRRTTKRG